MRERGEGGHRGGAVIMGAIRGATGPTIHASALPMGVGGCLLGALPWSQLVRFRQVVNYYRLSRRKADQDFSV